jgi:hypothetical protein
LKDVSADDQAPADTQDESTARLPAAKTHTPLGLPIGSIRALLTLLIVAVVIVQVVRQQEVEMLWTETLMIAVRQFRYKGLLP